MSAGSLVFLLLGISSTAPAALLLIAVIAVVVAVVFSIALWGTEWLRWLITLNDRRLTRRSEIAGPRSCSTKRTRERAAASEAASEAA